MEKERYRYICTMCSVEKDYDELYRVAAILQERGWCTLVPFDSTKLLSEVILRDDRFAFRRNLSITDIMLQRIDLSDGLFIYVNPEDKENVFNSENFSVLKKQILHASNEGKEIYTNYDFKDFNQAFSRDNPIYIPSLDSLVYKESWSKRNIRNKITLEYIKITLRDVSEFLEDQILKNGGYAPSNVFDNIE